MSRSGQFRAIVVQPVRAPVCYAPPSWVFTRRSPEVGAPPNKAVSLQPTGPAGGCRPAAANRPGPPSGRRRDRERPRPAGRPWYTHGGRQPSAEPSGDGKGERREIHGRDDRVAGEEARAPQPPLRLDDLERPVVP